MLGGISIHALRGESDNKPVSSSKDPTQFQSTLSEGRATRPKCKGYLIKEISIHALRGESDRTHISAAHGAQHFNPRSPRGERLFDHPLWLFGQQISIHALRGESDFTPVDGWVARKSFQSTLSEGRATSTLPNKKIIQQFQSTLSEGRATANISKMLRGGLDRFPNF